MSTRRSVAIFLFMALAFGSAFPAIKAGLADAPPLLFAAIRLYISAALLLLYARAVTGVWAPRTRQGWVAVLAGGVFSMGAGAGFLYVGQQHTTAGVSAIIYSLGPVLTVLFAWVLLPTERASRRALLGVGIGFVGVALVVRPAPDSLLAADVLGKLLIVIAITCVALGSVLIRRTGSHVSAITLTGWTLGLGAVLLHVGSLLLGEPQVLPTTPSFVAILLYLAVVSSGIGFALYFSLLQRSGPLQANLVVYLVPVVAVVIGWVWLGETVSTLTLVGFAVVFLGFLVMWSVQVRQLVATGRARLAPHP